MGLKLKHNDERPFIFPFAVNPCTMTDLYVGEPPKVEDVLTSTPIAQSEAFKMVLSFLKSEQSKEEIVGSSINFCDDLYHLGKTIAVTEKEHARIDKLRVTSLTIKQEDMEDMVAEQPPPESNPTAETGSDKQSETPTESLSKAEKKKRKAAKAEEKAAKKARKESKKAKKESRKAKKDGKK